MFLCTLLYLHLTQLHAGLQDRVALRFLLAAASDITASDVDLAFASEGIILGFNQEPSEAVQANAKQLGVPPGLQTILEVNSNMRTHPVLNHMCLVLTKRVCMHAVVC